MNFDSALHRIHHAGINPLPVQRPIPIWFGAGRSRSPIPVEAVMRRPLSPKVRTRIFYFGLAVVGLITILALRNDVMRYIIR